MAVSPVSQKHQAAASTSTHKTQAHAAAPSETRKSQTTTPSAVTHKHDGTAVERVKQHASSSSSQETSPARRSGAATSTDQRQMQTELRDRRTQAHVDAQAARAGATTANHERTNETVIQRTREMTLKVRTTQTPGGTVSRAVIETGRGNDNIRIEANRGLDQQEHPLLVTVNGETVKLSRAASEALTIRAGAGNDRISVGRGVTIGLSLEGNSGNDRIRSGAGNDRIEGGAGNDAVSGGYGRDYINGSRGADRLAGGSGNDVVYGGDGRDRMRGDWGNDYLEGSRDNDQLDGGTGRDVLSGGRGADRLRGGSSDDVLYAGLGRDRLQGDRGSDKIYSQSGDRVSGARGDRVYHVQIESLANSSIVIDPHSSSEFRERVEADLDMLRSSPTGKEMLREYDKHEINSMGRNRVYITETPDYEGGATIPVHVDLTDENSSVFLQPNADGTGTPRTGDAAIIGYNPQFQMENGSVPNVVLYHEMTHAYNMISGTLQPGYYEQPSEQNPDGIRNFEPQAVGLPNYGLPFDDDRNPATPPVTTNRERLSENGLRREMRLPKREQY